MINYNVSDFVGILLTIGLFAYLTNFLWWGISQILEPFFEEMKGHENIFHHHYHYKAK